MKVAKKLLSDVSEKLERFETNQKKTGGLFSITDH